MMRKVTRGNLRVIVNRHQSRRGSQIRSLRRKLDLTGVELAKQAGLSAGMLSKIENGAVSASIESLEALSRALNVPLTAFFARCRFDSRSEISGPLAARRMVCGGCLYRGFFSHACPAGLEL